MLFLCLIIIVWKLKALTNFAFCNSEQLNLSLEELKKQLHLAKWIYSPIFSLLCKKTLYGPFKLHKDQDFLVKKLFIVTNFWCFWVQFFYGWDKHEKLLAYCIDGCILVYFIYSVIPPGKESFINLDKVECCWEWLENWD